MRASPVLSWMNGGGDLEGEDGDDRGSGLAGRSAGATDRSSSRR